MMSDRAKNILIEYKISSLEQLANTNWRDCLRWNNCGEKTMREFREILAKAGLKFKDDDDLLDLLNSFKPKKIQKKEGYFWTKYRIRKAVTMLNDGMSYREVGQHFKASSEGMKAAMRRYNIKPNTMLEYHKQKTVDPAPLKAFGEAKLPETYIQKTTTLRDQYAMAALTGLLANPKLANAILREGPSWFDENAFCYADAMLKARETQND